MIDTLLPFLLLEVATDPGDNTPRQVRLSSELGGVYNWTHDADRDGSHNLSEWGVYPESTAFCDIGITRLQRAFPRDRMA